MKASTNLKGVTKKEYELKDKTQWRNKRDNINNQINDEEFTKVQILNKVGSIYIIQFVYI